MNNQDFMDSQNPYEYEKPLSTNKFRKYGSVATLGLLAFGTAFGGNALAATVMAAGANTSTAGATADVAGGLVTDFVAQTPVVQANPTLDANGVAVNPAAQIVAADPTLAPVQAAPSSSHGPIVSMPVLPIVKYGNVSSATPSASGSSASGASANNGSAAGASWGEKGEGREGDDRDGDND